MKNVVSPFQSKCITLLKCLFVDCKLYKFPSKNDKNKHLEMTPWSQTWGSSKLKYLNKTLFYRTVPGGKPIYHFPAAQKDIIFFVKYEQRNFCLWITNMELIFFIIYKLNLKGTFLIYNSTQLTFYWSSRVDSLFLTFVTETISRTDEGQPRPKYIFNSSINVELTSIFYSTEVWSITITEF